MRGKIKPGDTMYSSSEIAGFLRKIAEEIHVDRVCIDIQYGKKEKNCRHIMLLQRNLRATIKCADVKKKCPKTLCKDKKTCRYNKPFLGKILLLRNFWATIKSANVEKKCPKTLWKKKKNL